MEKKGKRKKKQLCALYAIFKQNFYRFFFQSLCIISFLTLRLVGKVLGVVDNDDELEHNAIGVIQQKSDMD